MVSSCHCFRVHCFRVYRRFSDWILTMVSFVRSLLSFRSLSGWTTGDQELQNLIDIFNETENNRKVCPVSGDLDASSDSPNILPIDSFNPRLGTITSVGSSFPSIHNIQSPNSSITSTPSSRSPMTPDSDYSIAFGDVEYKPNFRSEGSMSIGEVQQWAYADQQQTGIAMTQFRTKQQTYPSHPMVTSQPANSQLSYIGKYFKEYGGWRFVSQTEGTERKRGEGFKKKGGGGGGNKRRG